MVELTLNCWIRSNNVHTTFQVKISNTATVYDLQKLIKNEKQQTFRDVDAYALALYKPKNRITRPYDKNLKTFVLSEHAECLGGDYELSEVFAEPPPKPSIHIIVDAPSIIFFYLRGTTLNQAYTVSIRPDEGTDTLIRVIRTHPRLEKIANHNICLYSVSGNEDELNESIRKTGAGERLQAGCLAPNFLGLPVLEPLRVVLEIASDSPTLVQGPKDVIGHARNFGLYQNIFVRLKDWARFDQSDIARNNIQIATSRTHVPTCVTRFEQTLERKPIFPPASSQIEECGEYFECFRNLTPDGVRYADRSEVIHTAYIVSDDWEKCWDADKTNPTKALKEDLANTIFFDRLLIPKRRTAVAKKDSEWGVTLVIKRDCEQIVRKYKPRSDFFISDTVLPRLLVEVNSTSPNAYPLDFVRMLITGAFIVRFANNFVNTFKERSFVLCAVYISANGAATRYTLFQNQNEETVYYTEQSLSLNGPDGRAVFARYLYNLLALESDQGQDRIARGAIGILDAKIEEQQLKSFFNKQPNRKKRRTDGNDNDAADESGGHDLQQLRAHGYEVKPKVIVDASGDEWESLSKRPDHIFTVYRPTKSDEEYIAKKVREESNELEMFKFLDSIPLKSDHVISLIDSFDGWAILPKMVTIQEYVDFGDIPEVFVSRVCLGLIKGVAYLHEHRIAHRDIKPDNLVVDGDFNLKIIDFDTAMQVEDEDEEVDDQCGTRGWLAPEVERKSRHSPIKADRWACGRVILFLLVGSGFGKEGECEWAFARDLMAHNPKRRPSLLEWGRYLAPSFLDSGDIGNTDAKASRLRRGRMEVTVDGENMKPSNAKKQRLESGQWNTSGSRG